MTLTTRIAKAQAMAQEAQMVRERYQIGDDICGQVDRCGVKDNALKLARLHLNKHEPEIRVRIVDCMAHKKQRRRAWEFWRGTHGGESYRAITDPELHR